ncbi:hypothetical protein [Cellulomonas soli]
MAHATLTRLAVHVGAQRLDVALDPDAELGDVLDGLALPLGQTMLVDSAGRRLDGRASVGSQLEDGGVVHVAVPAPGPRGRRGGRLPGHEEAVRRRPPVEAGLLAVGAVAALVATVVVMTSGRASSGAGVVVGAVGCLLGALGCALGRARAQTAATVCGPVLGLAAAVLVVAPTDDAGRRLAVVAGLAAAAVIAAARYVAVRADRSGSAGAGDDVAGVALVATSATAAVALVGLLLALPVVASAAVLVGAAPLALRALPQSALSVPDEQLVDLARVSRTATSVRGPRPKGLGRVSTAQVVRTVAFAERRKAAGTVVASLVPPLLLPAVLASSTPGTVGGWGALALTSCVVLAFGLGPRTARGAVARWWPRAAVAVVLLEAVTWAPADLRTLLAAAVLALAVGVAALAVPLARGWTSVVASRLADGVEGLGVVLALPAALVAAGAVELLRQVTS